MIRLKDLYDLNIVEKAVNTALYNNDVTGEKLWEGPFKDIPLYLAERNVTFINAGYGADLIIAVTESTDAN